MLLKKFSRDEDAIELPINIVVMLVVGMVALAALLAIIPKPKENLNVDVLGISIDNNNEQNGSTAKVVGAGEHDIQISVKIFDKNNNPVQKVSVTLNGGGGFGANQTDESGGAVIKLGYGQGTKVNVRPNQQTIELKLSAKANGFYDYVDERAVMLYQTRQ